MIDMIFRREMYRVAFNQLAAGGRVPHFARQPALGTAEELESWRVADPLEAGQR